MNRSSTKDSGSVLIHLLAVLLIAPWFGCSSQTSDHNRPQLFCDAEAVVETPNGIKFITDSVLFDHGQNRTEDFARSGKASAKLLAGREFGMTYKINDAVEGERIVARIWRHSNSAKGELVVAADPIHLLQLRTAITVETEKDWNLLEIQFDVPYGVGSILIYAYNGAQEPAYFDDLSIERIPSVEVTRSTDLPHLDIRLDTADLNTIAQHRVNAITTGVLSENEKEEFGCEIIIGLATIPGEIRLKGDWTDHLNTAKWSFRLKMEDGQALDGKHSFSIQHPETRSFLDEWFIHEWFKTEGVLTTAYDFVNVSINGIHKGVFAREEHFEKQLPESQNRREGVILKLDETMFWKKQKTIDEVYWGGMNLPDIQMAATLPFKEKKTLRSVVLTDQFRTAQDLLEKMKSFDKDLENYIDIDLVARQYAIQILFSSEHGLAWHNRRWYFNPVTALLEPIAYDCSVTHDSDELVFGFLTERNLDQEDYFKYFVFNNDAFVSSLESHLTRMSREAYVDSMLNNLSEQLESNTEVLQLEFPRYSFDAERLKRRAAAVSKQLSDLQNWKSSGKRIEPEPLNFGDNTPVLVSECSSPRVFSKQEKDEIQYEFENVGVHDLELLGFEMKKKERKDFNQPISIKPRESCSRGVLKFKNPVSRFYYRFVGSDSTMTVKPFGWPRPTGTSPREKITPFPLNHPSVKEVDGQTIVLKAEELKFTNLFLFPAGYKVVASAGTKITLEEGAGLIIQGPVQMIGESDSPILVTAEKDDNHGFTVLQSDTDCSLEHVVFKGLNTLHRKDWLLTGAVNFYESDVTIKNCRFKSNVCEDGLNIIRSHFEVTDCTFEDTFSDAFDSDFCSGELRNSEFKNTANDAIDFSGSEVEISDCTFKNIGDKAVSGGEHSTLTAAGLDIDKAEIGIASKDLSSVSVSDSKIRDCKFGYVAYLKKPEYGGAVLELKNITTDELEIEYDIEIGSKMLLDGTQILGTEPSKVEKY